MVIETFCKYFFGEDIWGWGVFLIIGVIVPIPWLAIPFLAELPELCRRVRVLEEKNK